MYVSPDYPKTNGNGSFLDYTYQGQEQQYAQPQSYFYNGNGYTMQCGYYQQPGFDVESRRTPQGYQQGYMPGAYPQPTQPAPQTVLAPFSSYGGSGAQMSNLPVMPTLDSRRTPTPTFQPPTFQAPYSPQAYPPPMQQAQPAWAQQCASGAFIQDDRFIPVFQGHQIPTIDRKQQNWENIYVTTQETPMPNMTWRPQPVQQPQVYPMQPMQVPTFIQQPQINMSWVETYQRNRGMI